jgi:hypothetical protein
MSTACLGENPSLALRNGLRVKVAAMTATTHTLWGGTGNGPSREVQHRARSSPDSAITRNSSRRSASTTSKDEVGAASATTPRCASQPTGSCSPSGGRFPLRTSLRRAVPAICATPRLPPPLRPRTAHSGLNRNRAPTTDCDSPPEIIAMSTLRGFNRKTHAPTNF